MLSVGKPSLDIGLINKHPIICPIWKMITFPIFYKSVYTLKHTAYSLSSSTVFLASHCHRQKAIWSTRSTVDKTMIGTNNQTNSFKSNMATSWSLIVYVYVLKWPALSKNFDRKIQSKSTSYFYITQTEKLKIMNTVLDYLVSPDLMYSTLFYFIFLYFPFTWCIL